MGENWKNAKVPVGCDPLQDHNQRGLTLTMKLWAKGDLNPHVRKGHWHLKPARLPFRHSPETTHVSLARRPTSKTKEQVTGLQKSTG